MNQQRDPVIDEWLGINRLGAQYLETDQLAGLYLAATSGETPACPEEVLFRWYRMIALHRRIVDQSELAFITQARSQGWPWNQIADVLGLPDAEAAEQRSNVLGVELERTHPARTRQPWLPVNDSRAHETE